jgi:hypothetical protein
MKRFVPVLALALFATVAAAAEEPANPLFEELVHKGISLPEGPIVKLPAPIFKPGAVPNEFVALVEKAAGTRPLELFQRRSVNAPFYLEINSVETAANQRCGQLIHLTFIAYGKREAVIETDFLKTFLSGKQKAGKESTVLVREDLQVRGITPLKGPNLTEQYSTMTMKLLEKVQVDGVMRSVRTTPADSVLSVSQLDDRFARDKEYPNIWRHLMVTAEDEEKRGPPQPYSGLAGYVHIMTLPAPKDAMLVEMNMLLHEPHAWWGDLNLLPGKLRIVIQDNVRSFRKKLTRE